VRVVPAEMLALSGEELRRRVIDIVDNEIMNDILLKHENFVNLIDPLLSRPLRQPKPSSQLRPSLHPNHA